MRPRLFRRRAEDRALRRGNLPAVMLPDTSAGPAVSPRGALAIADAWACVRALADAAASIPLHVYRRTASGGRERVRDGVAELLRAPAPAVPQAALVSQLMAHLNLHGEAFLGLYRDGDGAVAQLGLIAPDAVEVEVRGGMPLYTLTDEQGRRATYTTNDIVHVKGLSLDGVRGVSPVRQAREALGYATALAEHGANFMRNGARPAGVLTVPAGPASDELLENLSEAMQARHGGPGNAGRIAVLSGEVSFAPLTMPMQDAAYVAQRDLSTREVARVFRVPPWVIGADSGSSLTYSTVAEQLRAFVTFAVRPWLVAIEGALAQSVLFPDPTLYPSFDLSALLRGDEQARASVYTQALNPVTGWLNRAEVRAFEDLPAEPAAVPQTEQVAA